MWVVRKEITGSVRASAPFGKETRVGGSHASSSQARFAFPLLQLLARGDPPGGADVREVPFELEERLGPAPRAWHRHRPRA